MNITLAPEVAIQLETITVQAQGHEFSGFGWARKQDGGLYVYDILLLHVGSEGLTVIPAETVMALTQHQHADEMRVWLHRHPLGNRSPGWHNWSGTDNQTIRETPLGGIPQIVKWSASIVRTPQGWVGRIDNHITGKTAHVEVLGQAPLEIVNETARLLAAYHTELARLEQERRAAFFSQKKAAPGSQILLPDGTARVLATAADLQWLAEQYGVDPGDIYVDEDGYIEIDGEFLEADDDADPFGAPTWLHKDILEMTEAEYAEYETSLQMPLFPPETLNHD